VRRPRRIAFVLSKYSVGGMEKQLANIIAHRPERARAWDVHTITLGAVRSHEVEQMFEAAGATNTLVDRQQLGFPRFLIRLVGAVRRLRPMVVSTLLDSSVGAWGRLAAYLTGVPVIVHSDRLLATEDSRAHRAMRPYLDRVTDRFLPNAHAIADRLVSQGVPREKIRVVHNGVDLRVFDPDRVARSRSAWGIDDDATVLGYLGRFAPLKRVELLLEGVRRLPEAERPDFVVLAGDGPTMASVRAIAEADPWLRAHCRFIGSTDDSAGFLANVDYLVLPSESEGLPNVVLEAMAMRRPVVATAVSDVEYLIGDCGFVARPGDPASLAEALRSMQVLASDARLALGRRARQRVEREFDIVKSAERFWEAHLELVPDLGPDS
jgi:glycosyltransferase involved in cell wall biosynthesis